MHLARANLVLCPPDRVIPSSPIIVSISSDIRDKSCSNWDILIAVLILCISNSLPSNMFSLMVFGMSQGFSLKKTKLPFLYIFVLLVKVSSLC